MYDKSLLRPLQLRQADIAGTLRDVCRRRGLRCRLFCGSMIGAVRHRGSIPWDDDLDVAMPRRDYDLLMANWQQWLPPHLAILNCEEDPRWPMTFAKVADRRTTLMEQPWSTWLEGVYVDIFPLDGVSTNPVVRTVHYGLWAAVYRLLFFRTRPQGKHPGRGPREWLPALLRHVSTPRRLNRLQARLASWKDYDKSAMVMGFRNGLGSLVPREVMEPGREYEYEGQMFDGPSDADAYLRKAYGDYMKLPPPEKRHVHGFFHVDLDKPWAETSIEEILVLHNEKKDSKDEN